MWAFLQKGGALMVPILAFSVVALMVFLERLWALRPNRVIPRDFVALIRRKVHEDRAAEALTLCEGNPSTASAVLASGLRYAGRPREVIKEAFEEVGRIEVTHLSRFLEVLGTIAAVAPLLGLLGTVVGMIEVFRTVVAESGGAAGPVNPGSLANGIWAALMTTAAGLSAAIPAFIGYKYLLSRVDRFALEMEEICLGLLDLLAGAGPVVRAADEGAGE
ncbi:MAG: MotA/TolQ/ExbB proton channel family protein [Myxococcales bacterium]|nr:MotA/TolQ/ExbB proton channel family protein [Myxococcales bacterium]